MHPYMIFTRVAIETVAHCNHQCVYCPVSVDRPAKGIMTGNVYRTVLARLSQFSLYWERISLNHYGEPTLDPDLVSRIWLCFDYTAQVLINTNCGLSLNAHFGKLADIPVELRKRVTWNINVPTTDYNRYSQLHGVPGSVLNVIQQNIDRLKALEYPVLINLQLNQFTDRAQAAKLSNAFGVQVNLCQSTSRAGSIEVGKQVTVDPKRLAGCSWKRPYEVVHIGIHGEVFLCCEDFKKSVQFGSLLEHSLLDLLESEAATNAFAKLHGQLEPGADFPCLKCQYAIQK